MEDSSEPDPLELSLISMLGRLERMKAAGLSPDEAVQRLLKEETPEEYLARNEEAMAALEKRILSPEYMAKWSEAYHEADPDVRARKLADLKRETYATNDIAAVHRVIAARNRQMKAEGILPPDAPI